MELEPLLQAISRKNIIGIIQMVINIALLLCPVTKILRCLIFGLYFVSSAVTCDVCCFQLSFLEIEVDVNLYFSRGGPTCRKMGSTA